jgi:hypothetical protein
LEKLSAATNAEELVMLMGFNETAPPGKPQGLSKLESYLNNSHDSQRPRNYDTIAKALSHWGYSLGNRL